MDDISDFFEACGKVEELERRYDRLEHQLDEIEGNLREAKKLVSGRLMTAIKSHMLDRLKSYPDGKVRFRELYETYCFNRDDAAKFFRGFYNPLSRDTLLSYIKELEHSGRIRTSLEGVGRHKRLVIYNV